MSRLCITPIATPRSPSLDSADPAVIARELGARGVRFERWDARVTLPAGATQADILAAYAADVARLPADGPYPSCDVVRLAPDPADPAGTRARAAAARAKFLAEHTHAEDEVRFFVEGAGLFYLRLGADICMVLCQQGDLLSVPAGTRHWFDMGTAPRFCAIRLFGNPDGWVASFTGDDIATRFPTYDELAA